MDLDWGYWLHRWHSRWLLLVVLDHWGWHLWRAILRYDWLSVLLQLLLYIVKVGGVLQWLALLARVGCVIRHYLLLACLFHWWWFKLRLGIFKECLVWSLRSLCDLLRWLLKICCWGSLGIGLLGLSLSANAKECSTSIIGWGSSSLNYLVTEALFVHVGQYLDKLGLVEPAFLEEDVL